MEAGKTEFFPVTIADNFYDDPDAVREFALSLEYRAAENGDWPGKRTRPLAVIDKKLSEYCISRFLSLYFDLSISQLDGWEADTCFQLIEPFDKDKNSIKNKAWVHPDLCMLAGLVYLTPGADLDAGTSIYQLKPGAVPDWSKTSERSKLHLTGKIDNEYKNAFIKHSNCFDETVTTKNVYNRVIGYDGCAFHSATNHNAGKPRLTQTFFLYNLKIKSWPPLKRLPQMIPFSSLVKKGP